MILRLSSIHLGLLPRVAVWPERVDLGNHVEGDRVGEDIAGPAGCPSAWARICASSSRTPGPPIPETDW